MDGALPGAAFTFIQTRDRMDVLIHRCWACISSWFQTQDPLFYTSVSRYLLCLFLKLFINFKRVTPQSASLVSAKIDNLFLLRADRIFTQQMTINGSALSCKTFPQSFNFSYSCCVFFFYVFFCSWV